jgi:RNA polymerase sigma-70 factor, ECF subfamily
VTTGEADDLVARAKTGDLQAFRTLFQRHRPDVTRLVFRLMGRTADLEDITQDVFLQVYRSLPDFRGDAKFSTWLHRVTVNVVLMARRSARCRPALVLEEPEVFDGALLPDDDADRRERLRAFARCIDKLAEKKRAVFLLHDVEGVPAIEVATLVDAPVLTVRTRLFYARKELADHMKAEPSLASIAASLGASAAEKGGHK